MVRFALGTPTVAAFAFLGNNDRNSLLLPTRTNLFLPSVNRRGRQLPSRSNIVSPYASAFTPLVKNTKDDQQLSFSDNLMTAQDDISKEQDNETSSSSSSSSSSFPSSPPGSPQQQQQQLTDLHNLLGASPIDQLRLESTEEDGVRGVHTESKVSAGDVIVQVPLESCLLDDEPPEWYLQSKEEAEAEDADASFSFAYGNPSDWATRLAASVVDLQLKQRAEGSAIVKESTQSNTGKGQEKWMSFLPNSDLLRASLPVHWSEEVLRSARCTALELAVDSSYFARAEAMADLMIGLQHHCPSAKGIQLEELKRLCENSLDIVQTRSCRAERAGLEAFGSPLRVLAPIFDLINHGSSQSRGEGAANARFGVEDHDDNKGVSRPYLCVRATKDVDAKEEVLIDYGDSAKPSWKCLLSYGFVPHHNTQDEEDEVDDDDNVAEVFLDGNRYEVGPTTIPFELVEAATPAEFLKEGNEVNLTPDIALKLAKRISTVSFYLLVDDKKRSLKNENQDDDSEDDDDDDLCSIESTEKLTSIQLAASLRYSQHHILGACAKGLQEWAKQE